ncbi:MotA/TolQ/ExbB proton channel family protein [Paraburkholderia sediminicola]|jgi:biopolymer transport protein ExbB|uniref:MotA/TolQ/ExbB proton channel family protein n=1 Tax=Paraburkholderia sediminicola TaxID=458836 RepID=UPI0038B77D42
MQSISDRLIVDGTLWLLGIFSLVTWSIILAKGTRYVRTSLDNTRFTAQFWSAATLEDGERLSISRAPAAQIARAGFAVLNEPASATPHDLQHSVDRRELFERQLRQQIQRERRSLDNGLAVLASIGSTAPFVGLLGTVFGIIHALTAISHSGSASIDVVAGPIGEALVTTGIGIAVAVPAVLGYNFFVRRSKAFAADLDEFATGFLTLAQKARFRTSATATPQRLAKVQLEGVA